MSIYQLTLDFKPVREKSGVIKNLSGGNIEWVITRGMIPHPGDGAILEPGRNRSFNIREAMPPLRREGYHMAPPPPPYPAPYGGAYPPPPPPPNRPVAPCLFVRTVSMPGDGHFPQVLIEGTNADGTVDIDVSAVTKWRPLTVYKEDNLAIHNNHIWQAKYDHNSGNEFDDTYWTCLTNGINNITHDGNDTLTIEYADSTTKTLTIENVEHAKMATFDDANNDIAGTYMRKDEMSRASVAEAEHAVNADNALSADNATRANTADKALQADRARRASEADNADCASLAKRALSADKSLNSDRATNASNADKAAKADTALYADTAGNANSATRADTADEANNALMATNAINADKAVYATRAGTAETANMATRDAYGREIHKTYAAFDVTESMVKSVAEDKGYIKVANGDKSVVLIRKGYPEYYWRMPNTDYNRGDTRRIKGTAANVAVTCTSSGITSSDDMIGLPENTGVGDVFYDGAVIWQVVSLSDNGAITSADGLATSSLVENAAGLVKRNTKYYAGDILYDPCLRPGLYLECIESGTTTKAAHNYSACKVGSVVNDGTAKFVVVRAVTDAIGECVIENTDGSLSLKEPDYTKLNNLGVELWISKGAVSLAPVSTRTYKLKYNADGSVSPVGDSENGSNTSNANCACGCNGTTDGQQNTLNENEAHSIFNSLVN